ncbi:MAG: right-handed parallel beta-helix repeat-containing protein [Rhodanobacteraceae bacterium]
MRSFPTIVLGVLAAFAAPATSALTFNVDSEVDVPDLSPGDGVCATFLSQCTLRAAVQEANAHAGADTILLTTGQHYTLTREGTDDDALNGDLDITDNVQIGAESGGERPVVDGNSIDRVFDVLSGSANLSGFDIVGGNATTSPTLSGGGIFVHAGAGTVALLNMRLYVNDASQGGGLYNAGTDTRIVNSEFHDNEFIGDIDETPSGSAILNRGSLSIDHSSFYRNSGFTLLGATSPANTIDSEPTTTLAGSVTIINSTLVSNLGSAIVMRGNGGSLTLLNTTVAGNTIHGLYLINVDDMPVSLRMRNTVIAKNALADCFFFVPDNIDAHTDRYNMDSDLTCGLASGSTNFPGVEPYLTPLGYYGGSTQVSWPLSISPMIDMGDAVIGGGGTVGCEEDDQQYHDRPVDFDGDGISLCDIGAVEMSDDVIFFDPFDRL